MHDVPAGMAAVCAEALGLLASGMASSGKPAQQSKPNTDGL